MRITKKINFLKTSLLVLLIAAAAVTLPSCKDEAKDTGGETSVVEAAEQITITVAVTGPDGATTELPVTTDAENLEDAFLDSGFISGDMGEYGLYIKTVNGITADYNTDGAYWAMYKDGEYLMTGAKDTPIADGEHYELVYTVG
ncbi:MAG: DUF4430 domain-containing protein [Ruminococcaceae bacterium]|nr:DUF4430 domain-containing protein [Oscillospiraceae bacterium]